MTKVFTQELVDTAVAKHGRIEQRRRLLSARLVVYFVLALGHGLPSWRRFSAKMSKATA
ncbi:transposase domain-containing protein [Streptomyces sp. NPDC059095]|uniref:transposase domain-containing protein n=1 Tax=Streptomyces sp. NPDC059095 TaxID=3346726 RepID=UPI0036B3A700